MSRKPQNHRKEWTHADEAKLEQLAEGNTPTHVIGLKLGRTEDAGFAKASELDISLGPPNQSPYNRGRN